MMCFNEKIATEIGFLEAVVSERVKFLTNPKFNKNIIKGVNWVYNTYEQWQAMFPFASKRSIERAFAKLEKIGILRSGYFCRNKTNRTKWYTVDHSVLNSFDIGTSCQVGGMEHESDTKLAGCITPNWRDPLTQEIPNNNTNNNNTNHLGRTKYPEGMPSFKADVVAPTGYICFDVLPKPASKAARTEVEPQEKLTALGENSKTTVAAGIMMDLQEKIEIERQELPISVVNAMNEVKFEGSKYIRRSLLRWVERYGEDYVIEKIKMLDGEKWHNKNAVLTEAIRWDWKENPKSENAVFSEQQSAPFCKVVDSLPKQKKKYPCGIEWWNSLSSEHRREVVARHWRYDEEFLAVMGYDINRDFYDSERFFSSSDFRSICIDYSKEATKRLAA